MQYEMNKIPDKMHRTMYVLTIKLHLTLCLLTRKVVQFYSFLLACSMHNFETAAKHCEQQQRG